MHPEIRPILNENELKLFPDVIINSFSTVALELGLTRESAPTNPAFITIERLLQLYKEIKCFGLYFNDLPAGFFGLEESADSLLILEKLSVLPEFRHRGYGRMILDYAVKYASEMNFKKIAIAIINENKRLKKWYEDFGFAEIRVNIYPHLPFEVCFMEFIIDHGKKLNIMTEILIRRAQFTDIDEVLTIEQESIGSWTYNQFIEELRLEFSIFLIAEYNGSIAGYLTAWKAADEIQLNSIAVKNDLRKKGIGNRLLSELALNDPDKKYTSIFIEVRSRNIDAVNFYTDNGFTKTGVRKNYYNDDDALLMEKKL